MAAVIVGLATAMPSNYTLTNTFVEHAKKFSCHAERQERVLTELYRRTEIEGRCSVLASQEFGEQAEALFLPPHDQNDAGPGTDARMRCYAKEIVPLAVTAAAKALENGATERQQITHLVTVSCTGFAAPGFDTELIHRLPLSRNTQRAHIGFMGCHGAMNGLRVANAFAQLEKNACVLLCAAELCSVHFQYGWETDNLIANSLFSDGAAALVIKSETTASAGAFTYLASASVIAPDSMDAMTWAITDHGFKMHLSARVPEIIQQWLPEWLDQWLLSQGLMRREIKGWAVHPGGPRILNIVQDCLELPDDALADSRAVLAKYGNMSSPTVLFILERMQKAGIHGPCVVLGFGPGLTIEAALLDAVAASHVAT